MTGGWSVRPMRHDRKIVWVIYCLKDPGKADEPQNRDYWPRGECPAWATNEQSARHMAAVLNELKQLRRRKGGEKYGTA